MNININNTCFLLGLLFVFLWFGCENMEDTYSEFVQDGEIVYVQKADSIKIRGGDKRAAISFVVLSDPKVSKYKVLWNNNRDSIENSFVNNKGIDTVSVVLSDMREDVHYFTIFTFDDSGNSSIPQTAIGRVYGDNYRSSLMPRAYTSALLKDNNLIVQWTEAKTSISFVEFNYLDTYDNSIHQIGCIDDDVDTLKNFPVDGTLKYRTAFIPEPLAIDTFYTDFQEIKL